MLSIARWSRQVLLTLLTVLILVSPSITFGRGGGSHGRTRHHEHSSSATPHEKCVTCPRDARGRTRSVTVKRDFMKQSGFPNGRRGYVVDHIVPLSKGGCDCPANMQWQTTADAKAKDRVERR